MGIAVGIIIFFIGCLICSVEDADYAASANAERRHRELMKILSENREKELASQTKITRRRIAQDKEGNVLAEEVTEETV